MNVLLVGPQPSPDISDLKGLVAPCFGLRRLQSWLRNHGHKCHVLNPIMNNCFAYLEAYAKNYDIIGFSPLHSSLEYDLNMMWIAHRFNPDAQLVAGGVEATFNPQVKEYAPANTKIIEGEGELPLLAMAEREISPELCQPLSEKQFREANLQMSFADIPYPELWLQTTRRHPSVSDLEVKTVRLMTSSHCPMGCRFCCSTSFIKGIVKYLSASNIETLLYKIRSEQPRTRQIFFQDDNFLLGSYGKQRLQELAMNVIHPFPFMAQCRLDDVADSLPFLGNFRMISVGIESFSQPILDEFHKGLRADAIDGEITRILDAGLKLFVNIILTSPNCTAKDVRYTLQKCREWMDKGVEFGIGLYIIAYPGCAMAEEDKDKIEYETVEVEATHKTFRKMIRILPEDQTLTKKILQVENELERHLARKLLTSPERSRLILKLMR